MTLLTEISCMDTGYTFQRNWSVVMTVVHKTVQKVVIECDLKQKKSCICWMQTLNHYTRINDLLVMACDVKLSGNSNLQLTMSTIDEKRISLPFSLFSVLERKCIKDVWAVIISCLSLAQCEEVLYSFIISVNKNKTWKCFPWFHCVNNA